MLLKKCFLTATLALLSIRTLAVPAAVPASNVSQIDAPGATYTDAVGINNRGEIVGSFQDARGLHGYLFRRGALTTLDFPVAGALTIALGINDRGQIVGAYRSQGIFHGFFWDQGAFTQIDAPNAEETFLHGINNRGQIVGHSRRDVFALARAFRWADGNFTFLDIPGVLVVGRGRESLGINDRGQVVGTFQSAGVNHGFLLDAGVVTKIDAPDATSTYASGIDNRGQIVGSYFAAAGAGGAYIRDTDGSFTRIDAPHADSMSAVRINDRSEVVGLFSDADVRYHGFLWTP